MERNEKLYDEIVKLAYDLYEKRGRAHGFDLEDWLKAERIVMERHAGEIVHEAALADSKKRKPSMRGASSRAAKSPRKTDRQTKKD